MLLAAITAATAQTHFYINSISVAPTEPTESDVITISVIGDLSSSGAYIVSTEHVLVGNIVHITVVAADPGGLTVLVPHTEEIIIGTLPAGPYGILVDGTAIFDLAPEFQHSFNVSGGGPSCDDLDLVNVQWAMFSDTAIIVYVTNTSIGFDYPGFILFDANGDTLAHETTDLFAIGADSWHTLRINPETDIPSGAFTGRLELWTGFYDVLACTWERSFDLCPSSECVAIYPYLNNFGNGLVDGSFSWSVNDNAGSVASGTFELTGEIQAAFGYACLPPGNYELVVTALQEPGGGQLVMGVEGEVWSDLVQQPLFQGIPTSPLPFDLLEQCASGTNSIAEGKMPDALVVTSIDGTILLRDVTGAQLGTVVLCDALGKELVRTKSGSDLVQFEVDATGLYVLRTSSAVKKVLVDRY